MKYPNLKPLRTSRLLTNVFKGYVHKPVAEEGAFFDTTNLTTDKFPLLATRKKRGLVRTLTNPQGLIEKDSLAYVANGTLYINGYTTALNNLSSGEKQLVSMGSYIVIFPDKVYYNTENSSDYGSLEASYASSGTVQFRQCRIDGTLFEHVEVGDTEPEDTDIELWICTAGGTHTAMSYSASTGSWVELDTVYTRIDFTSQGQIPALFSEGDGVTISGADFEDANGEKILYALGGSSATGHEQADFVVVVGLLESAMTQASGSVSIRRSVPSMDFVCEAGNRLWGCFYGESGGAVLNEIYCCALGDFKNWRQYRGLSTDSWTASVGSDGQWTGAVNYLGSPCFFKENRIHEVGISAYGAHTLQEMVCRGVQKGSHKSLVVVNETLYYKSRSDVCAWQGGFPVSVSAALGDVRYYDAAGGAFSGKYYLSMKNSDNAWQFFVYDIDRGIWCREDDLHGLQFAAVGDELYTVDADTGALLALNGTTGTPESSVSWEAVTGVLTYEYPDRKYVSKYNIRLRMAPGSTARVYLQYNNGSWTDKGRISNSGDYSTALLPIRPRRCDHMRLKLTGTGETEILSIARVLEIGSDMR